jgi:hypothetical protein
VRHRDQLEAAIEDAEHLVAREIDLGRVAGNLLVAGCIAEAQVSVGLVQLQQMGFDAGAMALGQ